MTTRTILALAVAAGLMSASAAMAQTSTTTTAPSTSSTSAPASTEKAGKATKTSGHHMAMRHSRMHHVMKAAAHGRGAARATSRDGGDAAVDALNAQSLARARGTPAQ